MWCEFLISFFFQNMSKPYCIVDFLNEEKSELVPSNWLKEANWETREGRVFWPPYSGKQKAFDRAVIKTLPPDPEKWEEVEVFLVSCAGLYYHCL